MSLKYTATSLNSSRIVAERTEGVYAAGAGVEYTMWALVNDEEILTQLSENVSGMAVGIATENKGVFTLYLGQLVEAQPPLVHVEWVQVAGEITDLGGGVYRYTITVTWQPGAPQNLKLEEVGARLPVGYTYTTASADIEDNLSRDEPVETQDIFGAWMVNWTFGPPSPDVSQGEPMEIQIFYITGTGSTDGHYASVRGEPNSVGPVGQIKGTRYKITATATLPEDGSTKAEIVADLMIRDDGTINITSWKITQ